jgi:hypothetical protein
MKTFIGWLGRLFNDHEGKPSIKRVFGAIGFISSLIIQYLPVVEQIPSDIVKHTITISGALLGLDVLKSIIPNSLRNRNGNSK